MRLPPLVDSIVAECCRRGWWRMAETVSYYLKADHPAARIRWRSPRGNTYYLSPVHFIDRLLLSGTPHDPEVITCLENIVRPGDVVWDAGANIGYITLELAAACPEAEYVCFEPSPLAGQQLLVNAAASGRHVGLFSAALSDRIGIFPFHLKLSRNVGQSGLTVNPHTRYDRQVQVAAVDTWEGDINTGAYSEKVYESVRANLARHFPGARANLLRMTFDEAAGRFEDGSLDLVFVDGCHTYEAVRHDYETWLPKMSRRGVMLFHDTRVEAENFGVWKFWGEVSRAHPAFEFEHDFGLGVLCVGREAPEVLRALCAESGSRASDVRRVYAELGLRLTLEWEKRREAMEKEKVIRALESREGSLCWRITAPLRWAHKLVTGGG